MTRHVSVDSRLAFITAVDSKDSIAQGFEEALSQIQSQHGDALLDVDLLLLRDFSKEHEEFQILFDLAEEAIADPEAESRYVTHGIEAISRSVQSKEIAAQLKRVESGLDLPAFNLSRGGPKVTQRDSAQEIGGFPTRKIIIAPRRARIKAELIDAGYEVAMAIILTIGIVWFAEPSLREELLSPSLMPLRDAFCIGSLFIAIQILILLVYPFFAGVQSKGQKALGLELLTESGREPKASRLFLRSLLSPLSALLAPLRFKQPPLRDYLSQLVVAVSESEAA